MEGLLDAWIFCLKESLHGEGGRGPPILPTFFDLLHSLFILMSRRKIYREDYSIVSYEQEVTINHNVTLTTYMHVEMVSSAKFCARIGGLQDSVHYFSKKPHAHALSIIHFSTNQTRWVPVLEAEPLYFYCS